MGFDCDNITYGFMEKKHYYFRQGRIYLGGGS